jgi:hypothetical protein
MKTHGILFTITALLLGSPASPAQADPQTTTATARDAVVKDMLALVAGAKGPKVKPHFIPLPAGAVRPAGWLNDWARDAASGITGHLDERAEVFKHGYKGYHFEARGVKAPGVGWPVEQCAYWLDGLVRLASILFT